MRYQPCINKVHVAEGRFCMRFRGYRGPVYDRKHCKAKPTRLGGT
ncbi:unnamed protein product, partial [Didymodactylos carnosus]